MSGLLLCECMHVYTRTHISSGSSSSSSSSRVARTSASERSSSCARAPIFLCLVEATFHVTTTVAAVVVYCSSGSSRMSSNPGMPDAQLPTGSSSRGAESSFGSGRVRAVGVVCSRLGYIYLCPGM
eukprot:GHVU01143809.1.p2 GENE.GHVU01143809.1~~GHVU01143809.1.p2  ORF type:complete len:126 (-),score=16.70 GHVU01143809.1:205-582(-)